MFQINPDGYLWYGEKLERHLLNKYGESADTLKYLDIYYFIVNKQIGILKMKIKSK